MKWIGEKMVNTLPYSGVNHMITRIQVIHFSCLRFIDQSMSSLQILVGANATGKTTFLDVVSFMGDLVSSGVEEAVRKRATTPQDLTWMRNNNVIELGIEVKIPEKLLENIENKTYSHVRYEIGIQMNIDDAGIGIADERVWLYRKSKNKLPQREIFPATNVTPQTILLEKGRSKSYQRLVVSRVHNGNDNYIPETAKGYSPSFRQSVKRSALGNLPADETRFPISTWLKTYLTEGIQKFVLNSQLIRLASPPGQGKKFMTDGSNLPWVVHDLLEKNNPNQLNQWVRHLRTALPDLEGIRTVERLDDKHRYLLLKYANGIEVPSWLASDGTLRLLALTLPAYLPGFQGTYLIEEPENGIHPKAIETVFQSLSNVYDAQVLLATHSPVVLSLIKPRDSNKILCFAKSQDGSTDIESGDRHPKLRSWQGDPNLSVVFAGGVLG